MLQALRLQAALDLAGHQDFLEALGRRHGVHALDEAVHAGSDVVGADEESGPAREEEMAGVLRPLEVEELDGAAAGDGKNGGGEGGGQSGTISGEAGPVKKNKHKLNH